MGSRRELFVDRHLIAEIKGGAELRLHRPEPKEVVFVTGEPWEGNTSAYYSIFQDGGIYRMYYRGSHWLVEEKKTAHPDYTCYAESKDGIHWIKPKLGLFEHNGSKENNIVWTGVGADSFTPFKDANPECRPEARYKAIARKHDLFNSDEHPDRGLHVFQSADGVHWEMIVERLVITKGAFDSQNLAFWDAERGEYREYHRSFAGNPKVRGIMTCVSTDFVHWSEPEPLRWGDAPQEHLYTNAIRPYERAPHILIGFPSRFRPEDGSQVAPVFMSSRDRLNFHRWPDDVIPNSAPRDRAGNRSNYMAWGLLELPDHPGEYSVFATEAYYTGPDSRLRRFTYRKDGFVSLHAGKTKGEVFTRPLVPGKGRLRLNVKTGTGGWVKVEIRDAVSGAALKGFNLDQCAAIEGDSIDYKVRWSGKSRAAPAQPVRVRFVLKDADLYSFIFE